MLVVRRYLNVCAVLLVLALDCLVASESVLGLAEQENCRSKADGSFESQTCRSRSSDPSQKAVLELQILLAEAKAAVTRLSLAVDKHARAMNPDAGKLNTQAGEGQIQLSKEQHHRLIARGQASWRDHMSLLSAVRADSEITSITALMDAPGGLARFTAAGDERGTLYLFHPTGELHLHSQAGAGSPLTALAWHRHNSTAFVLASGHQDGLIRQTLVRQRIDRFSGLPDQAIVEGQVDLPAFSVAEACGPSPMQCLQAFRWGPSGAHHYIAVHQDGYVCLWENDGVLRAKEHSPAPIVAVRPNAQGIFLTATGLAFLRLGRVGKPRQSSDEAGDTPAQLDKPFLLDSRECEGLNGSRIVAGAWSTESHEAVTAPRGFVLTHEGDLLTLALGSGSKGPCKVRHRKPLGLHALPAELATIHGYLFLTTPTAAAIFNITGPVFSTGPRIVAGDALSSLQSMLGQQGAEAELLKPALLATSQHRLVAVSLGGGVLGMFESQLPVKGPAPRPAYEYLMRPLFIVVVIGVAYWQFQRARGSREYVEMRQDHLAKRWPELAAQFRQGVPPSAGRMQSDFTDGDRSRGTRGGAEVEPWPREWPAESDTGRGGRPESSRTSGYDIMSDPLLRPSSRRRMGTQPDVPLREDTVS